MTRGSGFEIITLRLSRRTVIALAISEEGRHEDYQRAIAEHEAAQGDSPKPKPCLAYMHAVRALENSASSKQVTLRIDEAAAAEDLYYAVCSGTFQIGRLRAARNIANSLRERVRITDPALVQRWPAPIGA